MSNKNIEAILPTTVMQQALLFRRLGQEVDPGLIHVQMVLVGKLDPTLFQAAWQNEIDRHQALRTIIHSPKNSAPVQVVRQTSTLELLILDWTACEPKAQEQGLKEFITQDRRQGLDLNQAPVMRVTAIQTSPLNWHVIWTCHHALVDGWSATVVVGSVLQCYDRLSRGETVPAAPVSCGIQDYVRWRQTQDDTAAREFWRVALSGLTAPTLIANRVPERSDQFADAQITLCDSLSGQLNDAVKRLATTQSASVFAAWSIVLSALTAARSVVIGATVSGRPPELPGVESLVGCMAAVVPICVDVNNASTLFELLRGLRDDSFRRQAFDYLAVSDIESQAPLLNTRRIFDSLIVIGNYPASDCEAGPLRLIDYRTDTMSAYPFTLVVIPGDRWRFQCQYNIGAFEEQRVGGILDALMTVLERIAGCDNPEQTTVRDLAREIDVRPIVRPTPESPDTTLIESADGTRDTPPRDDVELQLFRVWESVLGTSRFGVRDDFFELGGASLSAVRMFAQIEQETGKWLPLSTLLEAPTIELLARVLRGSAPSAVWTCLVPLKTAGTRPPVFCLHAGGGEVLFYRALAERLGPDQPVYALQPVGLDGRTPPHRTVKEAVAQYLTEIRLVQPAGPYFLVGQCYGATLVLEMAQQLQASGEVVGLVAMIEGEAPFSHQRPKEWTIRQRLRMLIKKRLPWAIWRRWQLLRGDAEVRRNVYLEDVQRACMDAFYDYRASRYHGELHLILTEEFRDDVRDLVPEWNLLCDSAVVHMLPIHHHTMLLEPEVAHVARVLTSVLNSVGIPESSE